MKKQWFIKIVMSLLVTPCVTIIFAGAGISATALSPDMLAIQGRWIRTDAPYRIELRHAENGSLQAAYFNPKPINVAKTETAEQNGLLHILIELQDVAYPGSTYMLVYDRSRDVLEGIYYQAVQKQSFEVRFVRQSEKQ